MRRMTYSFGSIVVLAAISLAATPAQAEHGREHHHHHTPCRAVHGIFDSNPPAQCSSPVGLCTAGTLTGSFNAAYGFVMLQLISPNDTTIPTVSFYTGRSTMTTRHGVVYGTDSGAIDLNPAGSGHFGTLLTITGGNEHYTGATGYLQIRGQLNLFNGHAHGDFRGEICTP